MANITENLAVSFPGQSQLVTSSPVDLIATQIRSRRFGYVAPNPSMGKPAEEQPSFYGASAQGGKTAEEWATLRGGKPSTKATRTYIPGVGLVDKAADVFNPEAYDSLGAYQYLTPQQETELSRYRMNQRSAEANRDWIGTPMSAGMAVNGVNSKRQAGYDYLNANRNRYAIKPTSMSGEGSTYPVRGMDAQVVPDPFRPYQDWQKESYNKQQDLDSLLGQDLSGISSANASAAQKQSAIRSRQQRYLADLENIRRTQARGLPSIANVPA